MQNYNGIKAYVDANGSLPIGESSIPLTTSVNSEFWIASQKAAIRNGMMNEDKQQMLASIGVVYGQFKRNDDWQENYNFVKAYYEQHSSCPSVSISADEYRKPVRLLDWSAAQEIKGQRAVRRESKPAERNRTSNTGNLKTAGTRTTMR